MKTKKKRVVRHFRWKRFWAITAIVLVVVSILATVLCLGTDVAKKVAIQYEPIKTRDLAIERSEHGYDITLPDNKPLKILQLTDIHIGGGVISIKNDRLALNTVAQLIIYAQPDLVVITGDVGFPVPYSSGTLNNLLEAEIFAELMTKLDVPWVLTFGNHDTESYSMYNRERLVEYYSSLPNCLLVQDSEDVFGYGNEVINVFNADGSYNTALVLMDSNDYVPGIGINEYDIIHDDQVEWYKQTILDISAEQGRLVPSMAFFHIPLREMATAAELYANGSDEVKYYFGAQREAVACSDYDSLMFNTAVELGSTKAMFFGHDHYNDLSLEYKGIRMTYGKSIDYLAYAWFGIINSTEQRGGTLIEINADASFDVSTIRYSELTK